MNIFAVFTQHVRAAVSALASDGIVLPEASLDRIVVEAPRDPTHGYLATNAAMVLSKDAGLKPRDLAEKIKEEALLHDVPIVESIPLARALFASCDIDEGIPFELYEGVARLLAFVHRLRRKRPLGGDYHRLPDALTVV